MITIEVYVTFPAAWHIGRLGSICLYNEVYQLLLPAAFCSFEHPSVRFIRAVCP